MSIVNLVRTAFKRYPGIVNPLIYGNLYMLAEVSQQAVHKKILIKPGEKEPDFDFHVVKKYGLIAGFGMGPLLHFWYKALDKYMPGKTKALIVRKMLMDQFMMTPTLLVVFFVGTALLEGRSLFGEFKEKFPKTFAINCCFWLPIQAVNFSVIPPQFRVIYVGLCSLVWANILVAIKRL